MIHYSAGDRLLQSLIEVPEGCLDFVVLATGTDEAGQWLPCADAAVRALRQGGLLFVQGVPENLPHLGVYLDGRLRFKYWIAVESAPRLDGGLPSVHAVVLMFAKGETFRIARVRFPHRYCRACGKSLRDWGGKSHLMHPEGVAISDVWKDLPPGDNYTGLSAPTLETLLRLVSPTGRSEDADALYGIIGPAERIARMGDLGTAEAPPRYRTMPLPGLLPSPRAASEMVAGLPINTVIQGDALQVLATLPDESVDLVFADPPYNLDKAYTTYDDEQDRDAYLNWCHAWLEQYIRILKPTGSLYVLNLPRWGMHHAAYLNRRLYFQNWIVWDALSEPRGKIMPAHYALLFYTKRPAGFTFNYEAVGEIDARCYCLRSPCIKRRKALGDDLKEPLTDIWWDVHRIKHRRERDYHPCQLPDALMERIIRLSTNPGDIVLDALAGTGTTAVAAARLGRRYIAIDLDPAYVAITREKLAQVEMWGDVYRPPVPRSRSRYNKKALQLELREMARQLGRLPTPDDVRQMSRYGLEPFLEAFPTWGKALKAAKLLEGVEKNGPFADGWLANGISSGW
ncbi:MAG: site-specific DNA-methyltransferase [Anaerolineae bacterium]|nr:site-specific DNA-methyltransferase [Anaerolineae bacterium]